MEKVREDQNAEKQQSPFTRISDIHIPTTNIDTSMAWYTNILGFKLKYLHNPGTNKRMAVLEEEILCFVVLTLKTLKVI